MKGKLFAVIGIAVLAMVAYTHLSDVYTFLDTFLEVAAGLKPVSLDDLRHLAEEGKIPYEVYRLALYEKLQDPELAFRIKEKEGVVEVGKIRDDLLKSGIRARDWRVLEGRYVERVNDTWLRVVLVDYDTLFAGRYYSVRVNVPLEIDGYVVDGAFPSYLRYVNDTYGEWRFVNGNGNSKEIQQGKVRVFHYQNPNPEDARISREIYEQVLEYGRDNGLSRTQLIQLVYEELVWDAMEYIPDNSWLGKPFSVKVLDGDKLVLVNVSKSNSLMASFLLYGKGSCYAQDTFSAYVIYWSGIRAGEFGTKNLMSKRGHGWLVIPVSQINTSELTYLPSFREVAFNLGIDHIIFKIEGRELDMVVYNIMGYGYVFGPVDTNATASLLFTSFIRD